MSRDYYEILGVGKNATSKEIKKAYRALAKKYHPDRAAKGDPNAESAFKEISAAYATLSNESKRAEYDRFGHQKYHQSRSADDIFREAKAADIFSEFGFGADIFNIFFGGRAHGADRMNFGGFRDPRAQSGADYEAPISISFIESINGARKKISLNAPDGPKSLEVTLPPGVKSGQKLRLKGQGARGANGAGDLYLNVNVEPDSRFERSGNDIITRAQTRYSTLILGGQVEAMTPSGPRKINIEPGALSDMRIRVKGAGVRPAGGEPGSLYVNLTLKLPSNPTEAERELARQLQEAGL